MSCLSILVLDTPNSEIYPLVILTSQIETPYVQSTNPLFLWPFSIGISVKWPEAIAMSRPPWRISTFCAAPRRLAGTRRIGAVWWFQRIQDVESHQSMVPSGNLVVIAMEHGNLLRVDFAIVMWNYQRVYFISDSRLPDQDFSRNHQQAIRLEGRNRWAFMHNRDPNGERIFCIWFHQHHQTRDFVKWISNVPKNCKHATFTNPWPPMAA